MIKLEFVGLNKRLCVPFADGYHAINLSQSRNDDALVSGFIRNECPYLFTFPLVVYVCGYHKNKEVHIFRMNDDERWMIYEDELLEAADIKVDPLKLKVSI